MNSVFFFRVAQQMKIICHSANSFQFWIRRSCWSFFSSFFSSPSSISIRIWFYEWDNAVWFSFAILNSIFLKMVFMAIKWLLKRICSHLLSFFLWFAIDDVVLCRVCHQIANLHHFDDAVLLAQWMRVSVHVSVRVHLCAYDISINRSMLENQIVIWWRHSQ